MIGALLLWACGGGSPELAAERRAIEAFEAGQAALDAGDAKGAVEAFDRALDDAPGDGLLLGWKAQAVAAQGDLSTALTLAAQGSAARPGVPELKLLHAALLVRSGDVPGAGAVLARVRGGVDWQAVAEDPDFAPVRDHPSMAILPSEALEATLKGPTGSVFWGSTVELTLTARGDAPIQVAAASGEGPLLLTEIVEDVGEDQRTVRYRYKVVGAGIASLGPWTVTRGTAEQSLPVVRVEALAPPDKPVPTAVGPWSVNPPSQVFLDEIGPPVAGPDGQREQIEPGDDGTLRGPGVVRLELRQRGQTQRVQLWRPDR